MEGQELKATSEESQWTGSGDDIRRERTMWPGERGERDRRAGVLSGKRFSGCTVLQASQRSLHHPRTSSMVTFSL